jgi:hypothetical protein
MTMTDQDDNTKPLDEVSEEVAKELKKTFDLNKNVFSYKVVVKPFDSIDGIGVQGGLTPPVKAKDPDWGGYIPESTTPEEQDD